MNDISRLPASPTLATTALAWTSSPGSRAVRRVAPTSPAGSPNALARAAGDSAMLSVARSPACRRVPAASPWAATA